MVLEHEGEYASQRQAIQSIAAKIGCSPDSLKAWLKRAQVDAGQMPGTTTQEHERVKALEKEIKELRRANEILKTASAFFAAAAGEVRALKNTHPFRRCRDGRPQHFVHNGTLTGESNSTNYGRSSMPKRLTSIANNPKQIRVIKELAKSVGQKPKRSNNSGKLRNMGSVGTTYQNVYQA